MISPNHSPPPSPCPADLPAPLPLRQEEPSVANAQEASLTCQMEKINLSERHIATVKHCCPVKHIQAPESFDSGANRF